MTEQKSEFLAAHEELVEQVLQNQPEDEYLYDLAELFKVFGDSTRIKILYALFESELCVSDIAQILNLNQSAVSHQLRILKDAKLVKFKRSGKSIFYSLDDDHVRTIHGYGSRRGVKTDRSPSCMIKNKKEKGEQNYEKDI